MRLLTFAAVAQATFTRPAITILDDRQVAQQAMNTPSLNDNSACLLLGTALYICETLTPSFTALAATLQAPCLCYSSTSWVPSVFDTAVERCAGFAESAVPFAFGDVDGLRGFCGGIGDVLATLDSIVATTTVVSETRLESAPSTSHTTETITFLDGLSIVTSFVEPSSTSSASTSSSTSVLSSESTTTSTTVPLDFFSSLIENKSSTSITLSSSSSIFDTITLSLISSSSLQSSSSTPQSSSITKQPTTSISTSTFQETVTLITFNPSTSGEIAESSASTTMGTISSEAETPSSMRATGQRTYLWTKYDFLLISFLIAMFLTFCLVLFAVLVKWVLSITAISSLTTRPRKNNEKTLLGDVDFEDTDLDTPNMI